MLDSLLIALRDVSEALLPILGALTLLFLCILLSRLSKLVDSLNESVKELDPTLKGLDVSVAKLQAPLDTVVKYSHSLDKVHDKTAEAFGKAADFAADSIDNLKTTVTDKVAELTGNDVAEPEVPAAVQEETSDE